MVHAPATPTALAPCLPPLAPGITLAPLPGCQCWEGTPQCPDGQIWAKEWAAPRPRWWSGCLGRVGGPLPAVTQLSRRNS